MTYSQISRNSGSVTDMFYLEQQIKTVKKEMKRAEAAGLQELQDQLSRRLAELETELDKLGD